MLNIHLVPCLRDNYAYLVHEPQSNAVAIVDPSDAAPIFAALKQHKLTLTHIFNTHHHWDHTGGNLDLKKETGAKITGPKLDADRIPGIDIGVAEGDTVELGRAHAQILDIPAHTKHHIAFWFGDDNAVFTGDTMFAMGCGRLFEGTPAQMWKSLNKLAALPGETRVYCGHEYTLSNGKFAVTVEPNNAGLRKRVAEVERLRADNKPTIPSTIAQERETNPFLRAASRDLRTTLGMLDASDVDVFAETRKRKDSF
ncbi:MAG: hydroxyacylglutathione hydrolase [Alphaproteobacteria bacterium]|nr:hydroxyacylglutathione hydrolase [Alphaproteobacteria bacterium]